MTSKMAGLASFTEFLWSRDAYEDLVKKGVFSPEDRVELLNGKILTMAPQHSRHATSRRLTQMYLQSIAGAEFLVSCQLPLALGDRSEPEPDIIVTTGSPRDYTERHPGPAETILVVEISDASLAYDQSDKLEAYAREGIPEYWIVNLTNDSVAI